MQSAIYDLQCSRTKCAAVIKAAGKSRRFGADNKLLADLCGKPVLAHVLDALPREKFARIVTVVSDPEVETLCRKCSVETIMYPGGPVSETIRLGMNAIAQDGSIGACIFIAGDQPLLTRESCEKLLTAFQNAPDSIHRLAFENVPGAPVIFPKRLFAKLSGLTGESGGKSVMVGEKINLVSAARREELLDADTKDALDKLRTFLSLQAIVN